MTVQDDTITEDPLAQLIDQVHQLEGVMRDSLTLAGWLVNDTSFVPAITGGGNNNNRPANGVAVYRLATSDAAGGGLITPPGRGG